MRVAKFILSIPVFFIIFIAVLIILGRSTTGEAAADGGYGFYLPINMHEGGWLEVGPSSGSGGGISSNPAYSYGPSVAIAPDGTPYVAWYDNTDEDYEIYVLRWNGSVWEEVGPGSAGGGGISNNALHSTMPAIAAAPDGQIYVTWQDESGGNREIYVRRWNGSTWQQVGAGSASAGGISNTPGDSWYPVIAITSGGVPFIAWHDYSDGDTEIYIRRWTGTTWAEVGAGSAGGGGISDNDSHSVHPALAAAGNGDIYLAWSDSSASRFQIYVKRWNGSAWTEVGAGSASGSGISNNAWDSYTPSLSAAPDGSVYAAWDDTSNDWYEVYVRRWNGTAWVEVGTGSATGGGISNNAGWSRNATVAVDPAGFPLVTWEDIGGIYVLGWNGSAWGEVGEDSAEGWGISYPIEGSYAPALAISPDGIAYITWNSANGINIPEVYIRRHMD